VPFTILFNKGVHHGQAEGDGLVEKSLLVPLSLAVIIRPVVRKGLKNI